MSIQYQTVYQFATCKLIGHDARCRLGFMDNGIVSIWFAKYCSGCASHQGMTKGSLFLPTIQSISASCPQLPLLPVALCRALPYTPELQNLDRPWMHYCILSSNTRKEVGRDGGRGVTIIQVLPAYVGVNAFFHTGNRLKHAVGNKDYY